MRRRTARFPLAVLLVTALAAGDSLAARGQTAHARLAGPKDLAAEVLSPASFPGAQIGSQFCQGTCSEGYATKADLAADGPGIAAEYDRLLSYPASARHPLFSFMFEELFAAHGAGPATAKFDRLHADVTTAARVAGSLDAAVHSLYLETDVLPVTSTWKHTRTVALGDTGFEVLLDSSSACCSFQTAVVVFRVGQSVAVLFIGSFKSTFDPRLLAGIEHAAVARIEHP